MKGKQLGISSITFKSLKFFIAISIFLSLFLLLNVFGKKWGISIPIQMLISILLSVLFGWLCYKFDLYPDERKMKKNRIDELHQELEDFYLEEKEKLENKGKI